MSAVATLPTSETLDYLGRLFTNCDGGYSVSWLPASGPMESFYSSTLDGVLHRVRLAARERPSGIYVRMTTLAAPPARGKRGLAEDSYEMVCLWADIDFDTVGHKHDPARHQNLVLPPDEEAAISIIRLAGLPAPTMVVHSGGGLYPLWLFERPWDLRASPSDLSRAADLSSRWNQQLADGAARSGWFYGTGMGDLSRVLRLPGTINRKAEQERPCRVLSDDGPTYTPDELFTALEDAELLYGGSHTSVAPTPVTTEEQEELDFRDATEPGVFQRLHSKVGIGGVLLADGWEECGCGRRDVEQCFTRPGAPESPHSAHILPEQPHVLVVHSAEAPLPAGAGQRLTAGRIFALLHHDGDLSAAARDLTRAERGDPEASLPARSLPDWVGTADVSTAGWERVFSATPQLRHIQQAAHHGQGPATVLLGQVLARVALEVPIGFRLPGSQDESVGSRAELNFGVLISAQTGAGKSTSFEESRDLLALPDQRHREVPNGTGEGLQRVYLEPQVTDGKKELVLKSDPRYLFFIDEIKELVGKSRSAESTIIATLCTMIMGGLTGNVLATEGMTRILQSKTYRFVMVIGAQPTNTGLLLHDEKSGTPQRFLWISDADPTLTMESALAPDPGPLDWSCPITNTSEFGGERVIDVPEDIRQQIKRAKLLRTMAAQNRPEGMPEPDPRESHLLLLQLKTAALLALLHEETAITHQWWELAEELVQLSLAEQRRCIDLLAQEARRETARRAEAEGRAMVIRETVVRTETTKRGRVRERVLERLQDGLEGAGALRNTFRSGERELFDSVIDELTAEGVVEEVDESTGGRPKRSYRLTAC